MEEEKMQGRGMQEEQKTTKSILDVIPEKEYFKGLFWEGTFNDYLDIVVKEPKVTRTSWQRLFDALMYHKTEKKELFREEVIHYSFFDDPFDGRDQLFGLEDAQMRLVKILDAGAKGYGQDKRILLLVGPVGSAKSSIVRLLRKGFEAYTRTEKGKLYAPYWYVKPDDEDGKRILGKVTMGEENKVYCPLQEEPLALLPKEEGIRDNVLSEINKKNSGDFRVNIDAEACPLCRFYFMQFLRRYEGDWRKVFDEHVGGYRLLISEKDKVGIATFQPKDEKSQDATELTGDINYKKLAEYGAEDDPRAFNFRYGAFLQANRGILEVIEILKLNVEFLYDFLGASQEKNVKPKGFSQIDVDLVIVGHTNEPEYRRLKENERMEAFRDRTIEISVPYVLRLQDEVKIYDRDYGPKRVLTKHIAPHTIEIAAIWAILTRLGVPTKADLTLIEKLKLYDGKTLPKYTQEVVRELREEAKREALEGISPRYIQDKLSNILVSEEAPKCANFFHLLKEMEEGLGHHALITQETQKENYKKLHSLAKEELDEILKQEVQTAMIADPSALQRLCANYIDNVKAFVQGEKVRNKLTGEWENPDEKLMHSVEEKIDIPESQKQDFRREIMNHIAALSLDGKKFEWNSNERLRKALEKKLFEERKDTYKITSAVSTVMDEETQRKVDEIKSRMISDFGYCENCARVAIEYVASIWARGEAEEKER